jgi:hypothetical protein
MIATFASVVIVVFVFCFGVIVVFIVIIIASAERRQQIVRPEPQAVPRGVVLARRQSQHVEWRQVLYALDLHRDAAAAAAAAAVGGGGRRRRLRELPCS